MRSARCLLAPAGWHVEKSPFSTAGQKAVHLPQCFHASLKSNRLRSYVQMHSQIPLASTIVCIPVQNLDKGIASCAEETHGKSFHDAPDKVSFKAQVRYLSTPSQEGCMPNRGKGVAPQQGSACGFAMQVVFDACWRRLAEKYKDVSHPNLQPHDDGVCSKPLEELLGI